MLLYVYQDIYNLKNGKEQMWVITWVEKNGAPVHCWWECKMVTAAEKILMASQNVKQGTNASLSHDTLGYPGRRNETDICIPILTAA